MKHIHIVEPYHSNAMFKMHDPLMHFPGYFKITSGETPDPKADLNYHIPWHTLTRLDKGKSKQVMLYTHCNPGAETALLDACTHADMIICMSFAGRDELETLGADVNKCRVIYAAGNQRKCAGALLEWWVLSSPMAANARISCLIWPGRWIATRFRFVIIGGGWDDVVAKMRNTGVMVDYLTDQSDEQMAQLYNIMDIFLVTGYVEGGPLTVLEALSAGVPVLAPRMGYAADLLPVNSFYKDGP